MTIVMSFFLFLLDFFLSGFCSGPPGLNVGRWLSSCVFGSEKAGLGAGTGSGLLGPSDPDEKFLN